MTCENNKLFVGVGQGFVVSGNWLTFEELLHPIWKREVIDSIVILEMESELSILIRGCSCCCCIRSASTGNGITGGQLLLPITTVVILGVTISSYSGVAIIIIFSCSSRSCCGCFCRGCEHGIFAILSAVPLPIIILPDSE